MSRDIVDSYLVEHPEARGDIRRAMFAYNIEHPNAHPKAHYFATSYHTHWNRNEKCLWCGRTREQIRWGEFPPECAARPAWADESIQNIIAREIALFERVIGRAKKVAKTLDISTLTGEELARLHHTHGIDPSMLESALAELGLPVFAATLFYDYEKAYAEHCQIAVQKAKPKQVIVAK